MRIERITEYFEHLIMKQLGQAIATPDAEMWQSMPLPPEQMFGWMPPLPYNGDDGPLLLLTVCPELIDEQTAFLPDEAFEMYLETIGFFLIVHCAEYPTDTSRGLNTRQRTCKAEDELMATPGGAAMMELLDEVRLRVLDEKENS